MVKFNGNDWQETYKGVFGDGTFLDGTFLYQPRAKS